MATRKASQETAYIDQGLTIKKTGLSRRAQPKDTSPRLSSVLVYNLKVLCKRNQVRQTDVADSFIESVRLTSTERSAVKRWFKRVFEKGISTATKGAERQTVQRLDWLIDYFRLDGIDSLWDADLEKKLGPPVSHDKVLAAKQAKNWHTAEKLLQLLEDGSYRYLVDLIDDIYRKHCPTGYGAWAADENPPVKCPSCREPVPASEIEKFGECKNCYDGTTDRLQADWIVCKRCRHYQPPSEFDDGMCFRCIGETIKLAKDLASQKADSTSSGNTVVDTQL